MTRAELDKNTTYNIIGGITFLALLVGVYPIALWFGEIFFSNSTKPEDGPWAAGTFFCGIWIWVFFVRIIPMFVVFPEINEIWILQGLSIRPGVRQGDPLRNERPIPQGLRVIECGFNFLFFGESIAPNGKISLGKVDVFDDKEKKSFGNAEGQQVVVDADIHFEVTPEGAIIFSRYMAGKKGTPEEIRKKLDGEIGKYFRDKCRTFFQEYIGPTTTKEITGNITAFNNNFVAFVAGNEDLRHLERQFGVRLSVPSIFNVYLTEKEKDRLEGLQRIANMAAGNKTLNEATPDADPTVIAQIVGSVFTDGQVNSSSTNLIFTGAPDSLAHVSVSTQGNQQQGKNQKPKGGAKQKTQEPGEE